MSDSSIIHSYQLMLDMLLSLLSDDQIQSGGFWAHEGSDAAVGNFTSSGMPNGERLGRLHAEQLGAWLASLPDGLETP